MNSNHHSKYLLDLSGALDKGNMTDRLVQEVGLAICNKQFISDKKKFLTQAELSIKYQASRSVVREAMKMLQSKGLLIMKPSSGTIVAPESYWNLLDREVLSWVVQAEFSERLLVEFSDMRRAVLCNAAYFAAKRSSAKKLDQLGQYVFGLKEAKPELRDLLSHEIGFYLCLLEASMNSIYRHFFRFIEASCIYQNIYRKSKGACSPDFQFAFEEVLYNIYASKGEQARDAMNRLLRSHIAPTHGSTTRLSKSA